MPHNSDVRKNKLAKIQLDEDPRQTGIKISWQGEVKTFDSYKIPLQYLIYNKYNGRIGTLVSSHETQYSELDPENKNDANQIENFLWESKKDRNNATLSSIASEGQKLHGIVTIDGKIIDGNRRAMLLNKITSNPDKYPTTTHGHCEYFEAIILDSPGTEKELLKLETFYQMGQDEKLDYNPIEKYLKCKTLKQNDFSNNNISKLMNEKEPQILKWLETMEHMDSYLKHLGYDGVYTMLEKREDQFLTLHTSIKQWKAGNGQADWNPEEIDVNLLKLISFDYIRANTEGKKFRAIGLNSKSGYFSNEEVWKGFKNSHLEKIKKISEEEPTPDQARENEPSASLAVVFKSRDEDWKEKTESLRKEFLGVADDKIQNIRLSSEPLKLLEKSFESISKVDESNPSFSKGDSKLIELVKEINKKAWELKKYLGG
jgi:hypothetical protein